MYMDSLKSYIEEIIAAQYLVLTEVEVVRAQWAEYNYQKLA